MRRAPGNAGFLLAETLITFALSALVLMGLVASAAVLLRATDRSIAAVDATDDLGRSLAALRRDVSQLKRARWAGDEPQGFVFRGTPNSLYFALDAPAADGGRVSRVVSLREIESGRGTALMRGEARLSVSASGWGDLSFGPQSVVPTGPARLRFRYVAEAGSDGLVRKPVDAWPSGPTLPAAIIVEAVEPGSTRLLVTDRIDVRADADIGCADKNPPKKDEAGTPGSSGGAAPGATPPNAAPQQVAATVPGGPGSNFSLPEVNGTANNNEFCGRADKGLPAGKPGSAPSGATL